MAAVAGTLALLSLSRHERMWSGQDVAMLEQALWHIRHGQLPWTTMSGNSSLQFLHNFLGEHFSPLLWLLAWPAALTRGPEALLVIQALVLAAAAWPLARLATHWLGSSRAGLVAALLWLAQPGLWEAALYEFHFEVFGGVFLFAFCAAFVTGSRWWWLWAVLYAACKEDTPLYLAAVAAVLGWQMRRRAAGLCLAALALAYGVSVSLWIIPAFSPTGHSLLLGRLLTPPVCGGVLPWFNVVMGDPSRWNWLTIHLGAFALLPLIAGWASIPAGMAVGLLWLSSDAEQAHGMIHYPFTFYPLFAFAALAGAVHLRRWCLPRARRATVLAGALLCAGGLAHAWWQTWPYLEGTLGTGSVQPAAAIEALLQRIPPDAPVTASLTLTSRLARRADVRIIMKYPCADTDWIAVRLDGVIHPARGPAFDPWLNHLLATNSAYGVVGATACVAVLQRGAPTAANAALADRLAHTWYAEQASHQVGRVISDAATASGRAWYSSERERSGAPIFGHELPLPAGDYDITFRLRGRGHHTDRYVLLDVAEADGQVRAVQQLAGDTGGYRDFVLHAHLTGAGDAEFRVFKTGRGEVAVDYIAWHRCK